MSSNSKVSRSKQQHLKKYVKQCDSYCFFNLLTSPELLDTVEDLLPEHRERLFPPTETLSMFLAQALDQDRSCQKVVNDAAVKRLVGGLSSCSAHTGGYCRARQRLPLTMVSSLTRHTGQLIDSQVPDQWRWQGRPVRLIDGTTVSMPDTLENQTAYPQQASQKPGLGFPICRLVGVICLSSGALLDAAMGQYQGKGASEINLLRSMLDTFNSGDLVLGDALFGTYFFLASLLEKGVDAVFEQMGPRKRITDFRKGKRLGSKDHLLELRKPKIKPGWMTKEQYDSAPKSLTIRELKTGGKVLITTLVSVKEASKKRLKALYKDRWHVEVDLRNIKTTLGMGILSCKTPQMCEKEIWIYFLAHNLVRLLMAQAAMLGNLLPRQISFKHTVQLWLAWSQKTTALDIENAEEDLFILIAQVRVGNRPGRIEPRAMKRRPKPFPWLKKPREEARAEVREKGHQKIRAA
ncbi:MAG: IS4 family transposase [Oceanicoccus sp.]|uniref:IS4 family transposase n=1 Tax=Oceanicoccus sp. TaxID=2691044 RepID=UPI002626E640|nr:IS4 family transposase [Oceanicoccus sp.]MCP3909276.1 IS4 family transposase [Oceanicoccus sp.]